MQSEHTELSRQSYADEQPNYVERMEMLWSDQRTGGADETVQAPLDQWQDMEEILDEDEDILLPPEIQAAQSFLTGSQEYQWLLRQIRIAALTTATGSKDLEIHATIASIVQQSGTTAYKLERHVVDFLSQQYEQRVDLGSTIVLSGVAAQAYSCTCRDYVTLLW